MTWPTTPIDTQHLDSGADSPAAARPALNIMAQAVNSMVSEIDPVGVIQGDTLVYNSTQFVPASIAALIGSNTLRMAVVGRTEGGDQNNSFIKSPATFSTRYRLSVLSDVNSIVSIVDYNLVLTTGTYLIRNSGLRTTGDFGGNAPGSILIANKANPTSIATDLIEERFTHRASFQSGSTRYMQPDLSMVRVVATTETISYWQPESSGAAFSDLVIYKIA
jgi:hypothetical protein